MNESPSVEHAKEMMALSSIVFFEVVVKDSEDLMEVAQEIAKLGASVVVDSTRRTVKVFTAKPKHNGCELL